MKYLLLSLVSLSLLLPPLAQGEPLSLVYPNRPPYFATLDGKATGILVDQVERILGAAGLQPDFTEMPAKRILLEIQKPGSTICSFGWFKNPERESFANFSSPIYQDTPLRALILKKNEQYFAGKTTFKELAADTSLTVGLISGWSYGDAADAIIKKEKPREVFIPRQYEQGMMLSLERFLYTLARESEIDAVIRLSGKSPEHFLIIPLSDLQDRSKRYIMCGKGVPDAVLARINAAILECCPMEP
jgi:polar amino acid transport system substrate-binding protein